VKLSFIKIIIKEENFKWHLEAFASELFIFVKKIKIKKYSCDHECSASLLQSSVSHDPSEITLI